MLTKRTISCGHCYCAAIAVLLLVYAGGSCSPNQRIINSATTPTPAENAAPAAELPAIEQDIRSMRDADFSYIFVFRRKDGGAIDEDDRKFLNALTPLEINRRKLSDGGRAVVMGSNFRLQPDVMKQFAERFTVEDYSKPAAEIPATDQNVNS
jgi:hypothetical protein